MSIFRQFKRKINGKEEIVDLGALAQNITEDSSHRFVSDTEKQSWNNKMDTAGDIANAKVSFNQAASRANINSGETVATISGKLKKWYADFKAVVWSGSYNDLVNKPTLGAAASQGLANNLTTTAAGFAMDARQGPVIQEKFNQINSDLGNCRFGVTADGKPGYKKAGADTVFPFKSKPSSLIINAGSRNGYTNNFDLSGVPNYTKLVLYENMFPVAMHLGSAASGDYAVTGNFSYTYNSATGILSIVFTQDNVASYRGIDKITLYYFP